MSVLTCAMYGAKIMFGNTAMDILRESGSGTYDSAFVTAKCIIQYCAECYNTSIIILVKISNCYLVTGEYV